MSVSHFGDYDMAETVVIPFNSFTSDDPSASVTLTNLANTDVYIYKDGSLTQRTSSSGVAVDVDVDAIAGNHWVTIDLSDNTDAGFYVAGSRYQVRMEGVTIDGATINAWIGAFSIGCVLRPTTAGNKLDVTATGAAGLDWGNVENKTTANDLTGTNIKTDQKVDVETIKTQTITCAANAAFGAFVGNATAALVVDASGHVTWADGAHGGTSATIALQAINVQQNSGLFPAISLEQSGSAPAVEIGSNSALATVTLLNSGAGPELSVAEATSNITGTVSGLVGGIAGTIQTLDALDTAQDSQHATTQGKADTLLARIPAALFSGITSLAQWLGLIAGKQVGDTTARTELRATGAGSGTFDETTDSTEAIRDTAPMGTAMRGTDSANTTVPLSAAAAGTRFDTLDTAVADVPTVAEMNARTLVAAGYATATALADVPNNAEFAAAFPTNFAAMTIAATGEVDLSAAQAAEIAAAVETAIVNEGDATAVMQAIADLIAADWVAGDASPLAIASAVRTNLATELARIDADISSRMATYAQPTGFLAATFPATWDAAGTAAPASIFTGMTSLPQWLGLIAGKQVGDTTARTELRATGAGSGDYNEVIDSLEAAQSTQANIVSDTFTLAAEWEEGGRLDLVLAATSTLTQTQVSGGAYDLTHATFVAAFKAELATVPASGDWNTVTPPTVAQMNARTLVAAGYATPTNITAGTITTATNVTNLPTASQASLDAIEAVTVKVDTALVLDGAVYDWTAASLAAAPGSTAPTVEQIRIGLGMEAADLDTQLDAILAASGGGSVQVGGFDLAALKELCQTDTTLSAASSGSVVLLSRALFGANVIIETPIGADGNMDIIQAGAYHADENGGVEITNASGDWWGGDISGKTPFLRIWKVDDQSAVIEVTGTVTAATGTQQVSFDMDTTETAALVTGSTTYRYNAWIVVGGNYFPIGQGVVTVTDSGQSTVAR